MTQLRFPIAASTIEPTWATLPIRILQTVRAMFDRKFEFPQSRVRESLALVVAFELLLFAARTSAIGSLNASILTTAALSLLVFLLMFLPVWLSSNVLKPHRASGTLSLSLALGYMVGRLVLFASIYTGNGVLPSPVNFAIPLLFALPILLRAVGLSRVQAWGSLAFSLVTCLLLQGSVYTLVASLIAT